MTIQLVVDSLEGLEDPVQALYEHQEDGKYRLKVSGLEEERKGLKSKVDEFRQNNIQLRTAQEDLQKKLKELQERYDGIDPEKVKEMQQKEMESKDKELLDQGKLDDVIAERTKRMKADYENQIAALQKQIQEKASSANSIVEALKSEKIDNQVQLYVNKLGLPIAPSAMDDIISRARSVFSMDDDFVAVALDKNNGKIPGKDGITPLTIEEWAQSLPKDFPYYFAKSDGGQSRGSGDRGFVDYSKMDARSRVTAFRNKNRKTA